MPPAAQQRWMSPRIIRTARTWPVAPRGATHTVAEATGGTRRCDLWRASQAHAAVQSKSRDNSCVTARTVDLEPPTKHRGSASRARFAQIPEQIKGDVA